MNGALTYYLAVATILPLLLLNYFLGVDVAKRVQELKQKSDQNRFVNGLVTLGGLGPLAALAGAFAGEAACLEALFSDRSTGANAIFSFIGLGLVVGAGILHMVVVLILGDRETVGPCHYPRNEQKS